MNELFTTAISTDVFYKDGEFIRNAIYERIKRHTDERKKCLTELASVITLRESNELALVAAHLMLALGMGSNLTGDALAAKAWLDRAVFLSKEIQDLSCISKNLDSNATYSVSLEEAKRYGML